MSFFALGWFVEADTSEAHPEPARSGVEERFADGWMSGPLALVQTEPGGTERVAAARGERALGPMPMDATHLFLEGT